MRILQYIRECPWGDLVPSTMKEKGLGGRETALLQLGENWAKQGHEVINFVPTDKVEKTEYPGGGVVRYLSTRDFVPYCRNFGADVLVSWEEAGVADVPDIVDNIDLIVIEMQVAHLASDPGSDANIDYYAVLSEWAGAFILDQNNWISKDKIVVFPNGVDIKRFSASPKSNFGKPEFFYSSSPDRGLVNVLKMWPKIREKYPDAILHVAYGVDKWVNQLKWSHNVQGEIAVEISDKLGQEGIINHGKIGQDELAEIQSKCSVMLYPCETHSPTETGCCAAGTLIEAPRDHDKYPDGIPIEEIEAGQLVWTINEKTQEFELKRVLKSWQTSPAKQLYSVEIDNGQVIRATGEHPFMMRDGSWKELLELSPGDSLMPFVKMMEPKVPQNPNGNYRNEYNVVSKAIGKQKNDGLIAHHVDERHENTSEENILLVTQSEHTSLHNMSADRINQNMTIDSIRKRDINNKKIAEEQWSSLDKRGKKIRFHEIHPNHRCKTPCLACYDLYNYLPPQPEVTPGPGGKTARYHWNKKCEEIGVENHKVVSVKIDEIEPVYNLEVEDNHNYITSEVVIHNCISVVEAAAAGAVPVITDEDCLGTEFCELFPHTNLPFSEDKYLQELFKLLEDEEYYNSCRGAGFSLAASRDWSLISDDWIDFFETELVIKFESQSHADNQRANKEWLEANV